MRVYHTWTWIWETHSFSLLALSSHRETWHFPVGAVLQPCSSQTPKPKNLQFGTLGLPVLRSSPQKNQDKTRFYLGGTFPAICLHVLPSNFPSHCFPCTDNYGSMISSRKEGPIPSFPFSGSQLLFILSTLPRESLFCGNRSASFPELFLTVSFCRVTKNQTFFHQCSILLRRELGHSNPSYPSAASGHYSAKASRLLSAVVSHSLSPVSINCITYNIQNQWFFFFKSYYRDRRMVPDGSTSHIGGDSRLRLLIVLAASFSLYSPGPPAYT